MSLPVAPEDVNEKLKNRVFVTDRDNQVLFRNGVGDPILELTKEGAVKIYNY